MNCVSSAVVVVMVIISSNMLGWIFLTLITVFGCAFSEILPTTEGPAFVQPITNVTVPVGRDALLECVVDNLGNYKVAWLQVNTQTILTIAVHVITKNHRISVTHSDHRAWYLHIKDVKESDQGEYMCQINTDPMLSQVGHLKVVVPPDILDYPTSTDMVVREGSNVTLRCAATGSPSPNITWKRESGEKISLGTGEEVSSMNGTILTLTRVNRLQMGAYLCIASNGVPPTVSKRIMLIVHFPPMITVQNQLVGAQEGHDTTLECYVEAFPKPIGYWERDHNSTLQAYGTKYESSTSDDLQVDAYKVHMKLTIRNIGASDYGSYRCMSKNSLGTTDGSIKLYRIETPTTTPSTTTTTTTTTTRPPPTAKVDRKPRPRPKPTISANFNELADTSKSTANEKRGAQLRERLSTDAKTGKKHGKDDHMQSDKTAQSMSTRSSAIILSAGVTNMIMIIFSVIGQ